MKCTPSLASWTSSTWNIPASSIAKHCIVHKESKNVLCFIYAAFTFEWEYITKKDLLLFDQTL